MTLKKAVITAANPRQRALPLQTLIDREGLEKTVLEVILEDTRRAGIEEICVIVNPGDEDLYRQSLRSGSGGITFLPQLRPAGYAQALSGAEEFVGSDAFLHLVGDHIYSGGGESARRLMQVAAAEGCSISAVKATREHLLPRFGVVGGQPVRGSRSLYRVDAVREKPTPTEAEQSLVVTGLRSGYYLCFFGMHVLTPSIFRLIERLIGEAAGPVSLSAALNELARQEKYLALEVETAHRYDVGVRYGLLNAQLAIGLEGEDREEVLALLVGLLAQRQADAALGAPAK
ncbi:MAG TPA: UTP--glucose-1-phosphate uridylyltransferase [Solibacterales bacterium]|nr:UTP--glucose-1-phosphate uridylyltransferase [Bryobacterales bacterium]